MKAAWMTLKSVATKRHLLTQVEFPTGFLNSRATLTLLRKGPVFLGETHGSTGARERSTTLCQTQRPIQPSVPSPAVAVSQCPGIRYDTSNGPGLRAPWPHPVAIPACISPASICPVSPWTPADFSQPQKELHVQHRGPVCYCKYRTACRRRKTQVVRSQARVLGLLIRALE